MKQLLFIAFFSLLMVACTSKQRTSTKEKAPQALVEMNLKVGGMTCTECEQSIAKGVKELPGIDSISANYLDSTAFVRFDTTLTNLKQIAAAIAKRGYEVK